jgi:predicted nuclease with TOPRIM domain
MMANLTEFLHNPGTLTIAAVVFVLVFITALVLAALLGRQRRSLEQLRDISVSLSHLQESFVRTNLNLESVANRLQNLESQYVEFSENYELSKVELARLAEAMGGESQLTKAIDLARGGASAEEITLATGLGEDEASAIVKFHGSPKR